MNIFQQLLFCSLLVLGHMPSVARADSIVDFADTVASESTVSTDMIDSSLMRPNDRQVNVMKDFPPVVHSQVGDVSVGDDPAIRLVNIGKRQQYSWVEKESLDPDIISPKSARFSADGKTLYVNSLEGCRTVVYDAATIEKKTVINYSFPSGQGELWAHPSGFYPFTHYEGGDSMAFRGKPVESALSHGGRYLWVPFYRRTFDRNAQDPSALAVVDTRANAIVRMFETGPLPKMVAVSPDGRYVAITHWGDNTVGLIDISSPHIADWHHLRPVTVGRKFVPDYPLDQDVDRDKGSGSLLRGTVFTPDGEWLLVSAMGGALAVIDMAGKKCVATVPSLIGVRHLAISEGMVYGSKNVAGTVAKFSLDTLIDNVRKAMEEGKSIASAGKISEAKVGGGARTLDLSPDGRYIFVACNNESAVYVLKSSDLSTSAVIAADSYPVGLAVSPDGGRLVVTSQGKKEKRGGNAVNIYKVEYGYPLESASTDATVADKESHSGAHADNGAFYAAFVSAVVLIICIMLFFLRHRKR